MLNKGLSLAEPAVTRNEPATSNVVQVMRIRRALLSVVALVVLACGPATPGGVPSPIAAIPQRHDCGNLSPDICEEVIAQVIRRVPAMAGSPVAVTATLDPDRPAQLGGDFEALVAFAPFGVTDFWFGPPTWIVTLPMFSSDYRVQPWRGGSLPAHFVKLLRAAGIAP